MVSEREEGEWRVSATASLGTHRAAVVSRDGCRGDARHRIEGESNGGYTHDGVMGWARMVCWVVGRMRV